MPAKHDPELITYVDAGREKWQEFRPGSRRKVLHENAATGELTMLVQWDPDTGWVSLSCTSTTSISIFWPAHRRRAARPALALTS
jgi:hypothetical protein